MGHISLVQVAVLLTAAGLVAPLAKMLRVGTVLGYLFAGIVIGPYVFGVFYAVENILKVAEFGVVLLLFIIGLELKPQRLWAMRKAVFGLGGLQVLISGVLLAIVMFAADHGWRQAVFAGFALALSSTAMVLQLLKETGELEYRHGRLAFAVLLFQDLAAIPMIALVGLLAADSEGVRSMSIGGALQALGAIALIVLLGRYLLAPLYRMVARTAITEAMTALMLLTVIVIEIIMNGVGLSPALGAFIAGALLADSEYRHEIEANIKPFEGLLLGLFFIAIGMSLNLTLLREQPVTIIGATAALIALKAAVLYGLGRRDGLTGKSARRFALALAQGGEFAFVLSTAAVTTHVIDYPFASTMNLVVTLSMLATPLILLAEHLVTRLLGEAGGETRGFDEMPANEGHVIIAGLGRFGQIAARILAARGIPFTALDGDPEQVDVVRRFGSTVFYGDATRLDILNAAKADKARACLVCLPSPEDSLKTIKLIKRHFPHLMIFARARDRDHVHKLMDLGVEFIVRDTYLSALDLTRRTLIGLGMDEVIARQTIEAFSQSDRDRLYRDYHHASDVEKLRESARQQAQELAELLQRDIEKKDQDAT